MGDYSEDYLLDKRVKIFQPLDGYRASIDAVLLAAAITKVRPGDKVLDMGSGTGAITLCIAERFKETGIEICGIEKQAELSELSRRSAAANGFGFINFINNDLFHSSLPFCSFNHVITNPPYATEDLPSPNASKAAAHNFEHTTLKEWIELGIKMLAPQGYFYLINRAEALTTALSTLNGRCGGIEVFPIHSKGGQKAKRVIIRARKDSKAPLTLHQGLALHDESGNYSPCARQILREAAALE